MAYRVVYGPGQYEGHPGAKKKKAATSLIRAQETQFWLLVAQGYRLQILARVQQECDRLARLSAYLISTENEEI